MKYGSRLSTLLLVVVLSAGVAAVLGACGDDDNGGGDGDGFSGFPSDQAVQELSEEEKQAFCDSADDLYGAQIDDEQFFNTMCYFSVIGAGNTTEEDCNEQVDGCDAWIQTGFSDDCLEDYECPGLTIAEIETCMADLVTVWNEWLDEAESELSLTCNEEDIADDEAFIDSFWFPFDGENLPESCHLCQ